MMIPFFEGRGGIPGKTNKQNQAVFCENQDSGSGRGKKGLW